MTDEGDELETDDEERGEPPPLDDWPDDGTLVRIRIFDD